MRLSTALALLSAILLLFSGCVQKQPPSAVEPEVPSVVEPEAPPEIEPDIPCSSGNIVQKDECYLSLARQRQSVELCKSIYSMEKLNSCYDIFSSDLEICKKITDSEMKNACLGRIAEAQKSEQVCGLIENAEARLECLKKVLPKCMLISDEGERLLCLALEKGDYTVCKSDLCFLTYAQNQSESDACLLITSPYVKQACLAVVANDVSVCKQAQLVPVQDGCIELSSQLLDRQSGCAYATEKGDYRNRCYAYFAVAHNNMDICKLADPEPARDNCYRNYSIEAADTLACARVVETLNRENCYYVSSISNRMPSLCNPLPTQSQRDSCYSQSTFSKLGPVSSDCPDVASQIWRDKCYLMAAQSENDGTLCAKISASYDSQYCNSLFGLGG